MRSKILVLSAVSIIVGCSTGQHHRDMARDQTLSNYRGLIKSSTPTVFWGTLENPGNIFIGEHIDGAVTNVVHSLTNANVKAVSIEWSMGPSLEFRRDLERQITAEGIEVQWFAASSQESEAARVELSNGSLQPGSVVLLSNTLVSRGGCFLGVLIAKDLPGAARQLAQADITRVVFESGFKLTPETMLQVTSAFDGVGVSLKEFWVPSSTQSSGAVDLKASMWNSKTPDAKRKF